MQWNELDAHRRPERGGGAPGGRESAARAVDAEHDHPIGALVRCQQVGAVRSMPKPRGMLPWVGVVSTKVSRPDCSSIVNSAMLLCPRLSRTRNRPDGCTCTSAVLKPVSTACPGGSVGIVWHRVSPPRSASWLNAVTVRCFSLITYANRPFGWNAK